MPLIHASPCHPSSSSPVWHRAKCHRRDTICHPFEPSNELAQLARLLGCTFRRGRQTRVCCHRSALNLTYIMTRRNVHFPLQGSDYLDAPIGQSNYLFYLLCAHRKFLYITIRLWNTRTSGMVIIPTALIPDLSNSHNASLDTS